MWDSFVTLHKKYRLFAHNDFLKKNFVSNPFFLICTCSKLQNSNKNIYFKSCTYANCAATRQRMATKRKMVAWVKNEGQISKRKVGAVTTARSQKLRQLKQSEKKAQDDRRSGSYRGRYRVLIWAWWMVGIGNNNWLHLTKDDLFKARGKIEAVLLRDSVARKLTSHISESFGLGG